MNSAKLPGASAACLAAPSFLEVRAERDPRPRAAGTTCGSSGACCRTSPLTQGAWSAAPYGGVHELGWKRPHYYGGHNSEPQKIRAKMILLGRFLRRFCGSNARSSKISALESEPQDRSEMLAKFISVVAARFERSVAFEWSSLQVRAGVSARRGRPGGRCRRPARNLIKTALLAAHFGENDTLSEHL